MKSRNKDKIASKLFVPCHYITKMLKNAMALYGKLVRLVVARNK